jgi:TPR repeat protein
MIATTNRNAHDGGWLVSATRRLAFGLALTANCLASGANADALSAGQRAFARHNYVRAASLLFVEAERGSPVAQTYLGYMYQYGLGVPRDYVLAASWLHQAAEHGEPTGQFLLGLLFDKGYGVPQDWVEAEVWLDLAASQASGATQQDYWARVRDAVAQKLTLDQLAEAQRRASAWAPIASRSFGPLTARY